MTPTELNQIKIKDMIAVMKQDFNLDNPLHLIRVQWLDQAAESALEKADFEAVQKIERMFIEHKLRIRYYPSENRKVVKGKVVPIDYIYGSENA